MRSRLPSLHEPSPKPGRAELLLSLGSKAARQRRPTGFMDTARVQILGVFPLSMNLPGSCPLSSSKRNRQLPKNLPGGAPASGLAHRGGCSSAPVWSSAFRPCGALLIFATLLVLLSLTGAAARDAEPRHWLTFPAQPGPGAGKHIVLVSGDEEYRSEESLPMLAEILSRQHGFRCTVLFAINQKTGEVDPNTLDNIPGLEALTTADLMVICTRFRELPDEQMRFVDAYLESAKPVIGIRPAVVAFRNQPGSTFFKYSYLNHAADYPDGFGQQVLGSTWISHHGAHGKESTRGIPVKPTHIHPILRGVGEMWGPSDVYTIRTPIPRDGTVLVTGQVLQGMRPGDPPSTKPTMPLAWTTSYTSASATGRVFMTTMGASQDFADENLRRLFVNACYWAVGLESRIPPQANVEPVGSYRPTPFGFNTFRKGQFPAGFATVPEPPLASPTNAVPKTAAGSEGKEAGEIRNPKPEIRKKSEARNPKSPLNAEGSLQTAPLTGSLFGFRTSDFALRTSDFIRISSLPNQT